MIDRTDCEDEDCGERLPGRFGGEECALGLLMAVALYAHSQWAAAVVPREQSGR
jgi:hypothetical protein